MAIVRMSGAVIERVMDKIKNMQYTEEEQVQIPSLEFHHNDAVFSHLRDKVWGSHIHLREQIPLEWTRTSNGVRVCMDDGPTVYASSIRKWEFPPDFYEYSAIEVDGTVEEVYGPAAATVIEYMAAQRQRVEIRQKWEAILKQVIGVLKTFPTLNKALEKVPEIAFYIHNEDKERLAVVVEKRGKSDEPEVPPIDVEALVTAAIAHRMTVGGG